MNILFKKNIIVRQLGIESYENIFHKMLYFTKNRTENTTDEIWFVEHTPIFTKGQGCKLDTVLKIGGIPVIQSNRGGKITYHGPGQQLMYVMLDLKRIKINVRELVVALETTVLKTLSYFNINSHLIKNAPGVYVDNNKICSLGLRIQRGCSLHGLALNVKMDLKPFDLIDPCGFSELKMTQISSFKPNILLIDVQHVLVDFFCQILGFYFF